MKDERENVHDFAQVQDVYPSWILEYNPMEDNEQESDFATTRNQAPKRSSVPLQSEASAAVWHRRLGHIYSERLQELERHVNGVKIAGPVLQQDTDDPELCEPCQLAKSKR